MSNHLREQIYKNLSAKETGDLLEIWETGDSGEWGETAFESIQKILMERLGHLPPRSTQAQVRQILEKVDQYLGNKDFEKALSNCETAIRMDPGSAAAYNYRGEIYEEMEQFEEAIIDYQRAIQLDPASQDAWLNMLGIEAELEEKFKDSAAKQHLDQALEYAYDDEPEKALAECETAKSSMPNVALAYNYLGLILQTLNQLEPAIDAYHKATELNPRFYAARKNLVEARISWEAEQYHLFSKLSPPDPQEIIETDASQIPESTEPLPQWLYLDSKAFFLVGWPDHRTRQGRSGYDPLERDFESAHMQAVILRLLWNRKLRTRNPVYLGFMTFLGGWYFFGSMLLFTVGGISGLIIGLANSPALIFGALMLINVYLSLQLEEPDEDEDDGSAFC